MNNKEEINKAIDLLRSNGYAVKKLTESMKTDSDDCEVLGGDKECFCCSCSVCIMH